MLRILLKIALFPLMILLGIVAIAIKASVHIGTRVGAFIMNIFIIIGIINLIGKDIPCTVISGVLVLLLFAVLFFATYLDLLFDSLRDSLKRI